MAAQVWLLRGVWPTLPVVALAVFGAAALLTAYNRRAVAAVLVFAYVFPALIKIAHGQQHITFGILWMAALLGAMVPDGVRTGWHVPSRWRPALLLWSLTIVTATVLLVVRELDFYPSLFYVSRAPAFAMLWLIHVSLILALGILWFDWLFGANTLPPDTLPFERAIAPPLAVSALVMTAAAAYQLFVDFHFLNIGIFGALGRAPGTMFDANVCGAIAAMWTGGFLVWTGTGRRWAGVLAGMGAAATWVAIWASGSRTALLSGLLAVGFGVIALSVAARRSTLRLTGVRVAALAGAVAILIVLGLVAGRHDQVVGPFERLRATLPEPSMASIQHFVTAMWNRDGYGAAAHDLIRDFPVFGIGISFFHALVPYVGGLTPDNAQNWYRHQLVEFGLLGSVGWIAWVIGFGAFVLRRRQGAPPVVWILRGVLIAFAAVSLVGMPGQDISVAITFWTMAFWFVRLAGDTGPGAPMRLRAWVLVGAILIAFAAGTAYLAATRLRPPVRARDFGIPYAYGISAPQPGGALEGFRRTGPRSASVIDAPTSTLELTIIPADARGAATDAYVRVNGRIVLNTRLLEPEPITLLVQLPPATPRILLESRGDLLLTWRFREPSSGPSR